MCIFCGVYECDYFFFFQAEDGIRDLVRSRGLGDVYKRQASGCSQILAARATPALLTHTVTRPSARAAAAVSRLSLIHI